MSGQSQDSQASNAAPPIPIADENHWWDKMSEADKIDLARYAKERGLLERAAEGLVTPAIKMPSTQPPPSASLVDSDMDKATGNDANSTQESGGAASQTPAQFHTTEKKRKRGGSGHTSELQNHPISMSDPPTKSSQPKQPLGTKKSARGGAEARGEGTKKKKKRVKGANDDATVPTRALSPPKAPKEPKTSSPSKGPLKPGDKVSNQRRKTMVYELAKKMTAWPANKGKTWKELKPQASTKIAKRIDPQGHLLPPVEPAHKLEERKRAYDKQERDAAAQLYMDGGKNGTRGPPSAPADTHASHTKSKTSHTKSKTSNSTSQYSTQPISQRGTARLERPHWSEKQPTQQDAIRKRNAHVSTHPTPSQSSEHGNEEDDPNAYLGGAQASKRRPGNTHLEYRNAQEKQKERAIQLASRLGLNQSKLHVQKSARVKDPGNVQAKPSDILEAHGFPLNAAVNVMIKNNIITKAAVRAATDRDLQESITIRKEVIAPSDALEWPCCDCVTDYPFQQPGADDPTDREGGNYDPLATRGKYDGKLYLKERASLRFTGINERHGRNFNFGKARFCCNRGMPMIAEPSDRDAQSFNRIRATEDACRYFQWAITAFCGFLIRGDGNTTITPERCDLLQEWGECIMAFLIHDSLVDNWIVIEAQKAASTKSLSQSWAGANNVLHLTDSEDELEEGDDDATTAVDDEVEEEQETMEGEGEEEGEVVEAANGEEERQDGSTDELLQDEGGIGSGDEQITSPPTAAIDELEQ
jgi:hypothetical protein